MRCRRLPADFTSVSRDLLIGALIAAALIAAPAQKHLLGDIAGLQSGSGGAASKSCAGVCDPPAAER